MKRLFIISCVLSFSCIYSLAQQPQEQKQIKPADSTHLALVEKDKANALDSTAVFVVGYASQVKNNPNNTPSNEMPVVKLSTSPYQTTPIKKLSGKGIAPMPGTEALDLTEVKKDSFPKKSRVIKITTFPVKE